MNSHKMHNPDEEEKEKISIVHDLTSEQRKERKELEEKAKKMSEKSKENFMVRGPPWAWHIRKVEPQE